MKILVCVKLAITVPKYVEFTADNADVDSAFKTRELNEPDTYALEEALRMKEAAAGAGEVVVLTAGSDSADEALRQGLARGADRAIRVAVEGADIHDPVLVARKLAAAVRQEAPDLVLCGVQSSDAAQQSTGPALASALQWPAVSVATRIEPAEGGLRVQREFEGGLREVVTLPLPAVVTVQIGLNAPRYGSFKGMMKAKKTVIPVVEAAGTGPARVTVRRMFVPEAAGKRSVDMITGGAAEVAQRIIELVKEARA